MRAYRAVLIGILLCLVVSVSAYSQDTGMVDPSDPNAVANQTESLADRARKLRVNKPREVQTTTEDAKALFRSVDEIFAFASQDTGFPIRHSVKRRLVSREDVEKETRDRLTKTDLKDHFARTELTMKKFGLLPRDFNMREFAVKSNVEDLAGYYDPTTKTISLVNWVPLDQMRPVLAHELTHALQDQNYDLDHWAEAGRPKDASQSTDSSSDETVLVRHAVGEGQAMIVYIDYMLAPLGRNFQNTPGVLARLEDPAVKAVVDTEFLHNAPMIMREAGTFPYREGLIFEGELLEHGGKPMAFPGAFARPPATTHEVLEPRAYLEHEYIAPVRIPDMKGLVAGKYEMYDSGSIGELDVRALLEQYGERRIANELASNWRGGTYLAFKRTQSAASPTTADVALLYVSRWKSDKAAEQFAKIYIDSVATRYQKPSPQSLVACTDASCPVSRTEVGTEEGPVIVEQWSDNSVIISEGFDETTSAQLRHAVRNGDGTQHAQTWSQEELGMRFYGVPAFRQMQADLMQKLLRSLKPLPAVNGAGIQ